MIGNAGGRNRAPFAVAAWAGATAVASAVAWLGVDSVLIPAAVPPPAVLAAGAHTSPALTITLSPPLVPSPTPSPSPRSALSPSKPPNSGSAHLTPPPAPASPSVSISATSPSPSPSPTASLSRYETAGGVVVLAMHPNSVSLVSATPASGYSVQNWSAPGWLRVDFNEGSTTYSVFATWNGYSPQVQVVGPN